jgi:hypothetical protein
VHRAIGGVRRFLEHSSDMDEQVIEIDSIRFEQRLLIRGVNSSDNRVDMSPDRLSVRRLVPLNGIDFDPEHLE